MATEILAVATGVANSTDVVVEVGDQLTVALKGADDANPRPNGRVDIQIKDDDGQYWVVDTLALGRPAIVIVAAGTYRFARTLGGQAVGVFSA